MFIKKLVIKDGEHIIRSIEFKLGVNLIVDTSLKLNDKQTGNSVGKTTVLRLIDFCLGAEPDIIYKGGENIGDIYHEVADFLNSREINIILTMLYDWNDEGNSIVLIRNFSWSRDRIKCYINGDVFSINEYRSKLRMLFFPHLVDRKPSFREIISHNIRYDETRLDATLKTLHVTTSHDEYDVLNLFLFNSDSSAAERRMRLKKELEIQRGFQRGLSAEYRLKDLEKKLKIQLKLIEETKKSIETLFVNCERDEDVNNLNKLRKKRSDCIQTIAEIDFKMRIINQTISDFKKDIYTENIESIQALYSEAKNILPEVMVSFDSLVKFHNQMNKEKIRFVQQELSTCQAMRERKGRELDSIEEEIIKHEDKIRNTITVEQMECLVARLNEAHVRKGEYEMCIKQLKDVKSRVDQLKVESSQPEENDDLISTEEQLINNVNIFNAFFGEVSKMLYGEENRLIVTKNSKGNYDFQFVIPSNSAGRKQGESLCFDVAYIMYSDSVKKPCIHFMLNDKKELMDANQLEMLPLIVENKPMQLIISMLYDKLPESIQTEVKKYEVLTLSENDKLFKL